MEELQKSHIREHIHTERAQLLTITQEIAKVVVGHTDILQAILIAILCKGHVLLEGVPGVAKTTIVKALAQALGLSFSRVQFTPDLLPADIIGTLIYNSKTQEFETKKGPIFANLVLADEINRAPAKVQAALLEAMQEQQVTIGGTTYKLEDPFLVFATQNPLEQEGTYRLPEAQIDRFMFKLLLHYPTLTQEKEILYNQVSAQTVTTITTKEQIILQQNLIDQIYCDDKIVDYIVRIIFATREPQAYGLTELHKYLAGGVSPRATITLYKTAKAHAFLKDRYFATPDDVKAVAPYALRHRITLNYEAEADGISSDSIIKKILIALPTP